MRIKKGGSIGSASGRAKLAQRREPYWAVIVRGCALGYRKGAKGGTWIARKYNPNTQDTTYEAIGVADDLNDGNGLTYEAALTEARRVFGTTNAGRLTLSDVLDRYLAHVKANNPASTIADYESRIEGILKPELGNVPIVKLTSVRLTDWRNKAAEGRKPDTVNRLLAILKAALNLAWKQGLIADDTAWRRVDTFKDAGNARQVHFTREQCAALVTACKDAALARLVHAGVLTGARFGELAALRVRDFDEAHGSIEIRAGKTGRRTVYLSDEAVRFFGACARDKAANAILLPRADGDAWGANHYQKGFAAAVKVASLDADATFYALRHTHISLALLAGVNIQVLAENCGTSVRMIEKHYGKFLRADRRAMFNAMPRLVAQAA